MKKIAVILYSHSSYSDLWDVFFAQLGKYFKDDRFAYYFFNDSSATREGFQTVTYADSLSYSQRLSACLEFVEEERFILFHEDMIIYDKCDIEKIISFNQFLDDEKNYFCVKFLKGGIGLDESYPLGNDLYLHSNITTMFSIQPSLFDKDRFKSIIAGKDRNIWELEAVASMDAVDKGKFTAYHFDGGKQRGMYHWDSTVCPYIATAIVKGKWNTFEYPGELNLLRDCYNLDFLKRGEFDGR